MTNYAIVKTNSGWSQLYTLQQAGVAGKTEAEMEAIALANPVSNMTINSWNFISLNPRDVGATAVTSDITGCNVDEQEQSSSNWATDASGSSSGNWYSGSNIQAYVRPTQNSQYYKQRFAPIHQGQWFGEYTIKVYMYIKKTHIITATAGSGGYIQPIGNVEVNEGSDITFTVNANSNYHIKSIKVDGSDIPL